MKNPSIQGRSQGGVSAFVALLAISTAFLGLAWSGAAGTGGASSSGRKPGQREPLTQIPEAQHPIAPSNWNLCVDPVQRQLLSFLSEALQNAPNQQAMNSRAVDMSAVADAILFQLYVAVYERLPEGERDVFRKEQSLWLEKRAAQSNASVKGGTMAPMDYNLEFLDLTRQRAAVLEERLRGMGAK